MPARSEGGIVSHHNLAAILEKMHSDELAELLERLIEDASHRLGRHGPIANDYEYSAEAFVNEAITRALEERRACPSGLPVYVFLANTVKSLISHEGQRPEYRRKRVRLDADDDASASVVDTLPANDDVEATVTASVASDRFKKSLDPELREYVETLEKEAGSTAEDLAKKLRKPVKTIRNLDRKLSRRRSQWNPR
jgi:hypothetical protein